MIFVAAQYEHSIGLTGLKAMSFLLCAPNINVPLGISGNTTEILSDPMKANNVQLTRNIRGLGCANQAVAMNFVQWQQHGGTNIWKKVTDPDSDSSPDSDPIPVVEIRMGSESYSVQSERFCMAH